MYVTSEARTLDALDKRSELLGIFTFPTGLSRKIDVANDNFLPGNWVTIVNRGPGLPIILSEVRVYGREFPIGQTPLNPQTTYTLLPFFVSSIYIKTGDDQYADSDAKLQMKICDAQNNCCQTSSLETQKDNLERGQIDVFTYNADNSPSSLGNCAGNTVV